MGFFITMNVTSALHPSTMRILKQQNSSLSTFFGLQRVFSFNAVFQPDSKKDKGYVIVCKVDLRNHNLLFKNREFLIKKKQNFIVGYHNHVMQRVVLIVSTSRSNGKRTNSL